MFIGNGGYSCNGLFKLSVNETKENSVYTIDSLLLWHARLGHLNYSSLKYLSKHGLISITNNDYDKHEYAYKPS